jgi:hypothetical protein
MKHEKCICEKIVDHLVFRLNTSHDRRELEVVKSILLACGVISVKNKNDNDRSLVIRK